MSALVLSPGVETSKIARSGDQDAHKEVNRVLSVAILNITGCGVPEQTIILFYLFIYKSVGAGDPEEQLGLLEFLKLRTYPEHPVSHMDRDLFQFDILAYQ